jgi:hypothetical protein
MAAIMTDTTPPRNPVAFHATFHALTGVIPLHQGRALFLEPESGAVVTLTEADVPAVVRLGRVDLAMAQWIKDMAAGGYAQIATHRLQEVA